MSAHCSPPFPLIAVLLPWLRGCTDTALLSAAHRSAGVELMGVVPDQEPKITTLNTQIAKGSYLTAQLPKGVVIGDKLASTIGIELNSEIVLLTQAADGSMGNDVYTVVGILHTGLDAVDRGLVLMSLSSLQDLLHLAPARIHEVGIKLNHITAATTVAAALEVQLGKTLPVRVMAWPELAPELANYVQFNHGVTVVLFFIFFLVAVIGVMNTMLMAVFERTREFGMLMAVGMRPAQVIRSDPDRSCRLGASPVWSWEQRLEFRCSGICRYMVWIWVALPARWSPSQEWWWAISGTAGRIFPPTARQHSGWPQPLWCLRSIPPGELLSSGRRKRCVRSDSDKSIPSREDQLAQPLAQSPRYAADRTGAGSGAGVAADLFGPARRRPRTNDCRRGAVWAGACSRPGEGLSRLQLRRTPASGSGRVQRRRIFANRRTSRRLCEELVPGFWPPVF